MDQERDPQKIQGTRFITAPDHTPSSKPGNTTSTSTVISDVAASAETGTIPDCCRSHQAPNVPPYHSDIASSRPDPAVSSSSSSLAAVNPPTIVSSITMRAMATRNSSFTDTAGTPLPADAKDHHHNDQRQTDESTVCLEKHSRRRVHEHKQEQQETSKRKKTNESFGEVNKETMSEEISESESDNESNDEDYQGFDQDSSESESQGGCKKKVTQKKGNPPPLELVCDFCEKRIHPQNIVSTCGDNIHIGGLNEHDLVKLRQRRDAKQCTAAICKTCTHHYRRIFLPCCCCQQAEDCTPFYYAKRSARSVGDATCVSVTKCCPTQSLTGSKEKRTYAISVKSRKMTE